MLALLGSLATSIGLVVRVSAERARPRLAGSTTAALGLVLLIATGGLAMAARHFRLSSKLAVVIVAEARLLEKSGRPKPIAKDSSEAIPEGARVYTLAQQDGLAKVHWGNVEGWVQENQLLVIVKEAQ